MNMHKLNIRFVISTSRVRKDNKASLTCRLTYNKIRKTFSAGLFINPDYWNSKQQYVDPPEPDNDILNSQLSLIKKKINRPFYCFKLKKRVLMWMIFTACIKVLKHKKNTIVEFFERHLKKLKTLINIDIKQVTWNKFNYIKKDVKSFIKWQFKANDVRTIPGT